MTTAHDITGKDVIGIPGQNLTGNELKIVVGLADGEHSSELAEQLNLDSREMRHLERDIRAKLGAKSNPHMISRAFILGVLAPRALCLALAILMLAPASHDMYRQARTRTSSLRIRLRRNESDGLA